MLLHCRSYLFAKTASAGIAGTGGSISLCAYVLKESFSVISIPCLSAGQPHWPRFLDDRAVPELRTRQSEIRERQ